MTAEVETTKDKEPAGDAIVTERGKRFEEDTDTSERGEAGTGERLNDGERLGGGRHEYQDTGSDAEDGDDDDGARAALDRQAKRLRLSNTHHGHVLTALRRLHADTKAGGTVSRDDLAEVLEMAEAAHSNPVPQPESGSVVHGTTGPGAPPDIHHTPFSTVERRRQPGQ